MIPPIASRFVAGETAAEALEHAASLNERGVGAMLNLLGEHYHDRRPAKADTAAYVDLLSDIENGGYRACVSVKPSQLGLDVIDTSGGRRGRVAEAIAPDGWTRGRSAEATAAESDESLFRHNLERIVQTAAPGGFVWIDMEDHTTVDATLAAFEAMADIHPNGVGVCLQANMTRTRDDLRRLTDVPGKIRLVKGAYDPPDDLAVGGRSAVDRAYRDLLEVAFRERDGGVAVGSHDPAMIEHAIALHEEYGTGFEVQMLMGVRERAQFSLAAEHEVYQYVPFGSKWFSYFYRRVLERSENVRFALRAIAGTLGRGD